MELTRYQKILLAALAGMLVLFSVLMAVFRSGPGVLFEESLLEIAGEGVYTGRVMGEPVAITVTRPSDSRAVVEFAIGDRFRDVCQVDYPLTPVETVRGPVDGIRVTKNGAVLFQGAYARDMDGGWFDENGDWAPQFTVRAYTSGDPWRYYETDAATAVSFALGPGTAAHGDPGLFALAVFLTALLAVWILFHKQLFRFEHRWARDPEPTEGYLFLERAVWLLAAAAVAGVYLAAMVTVS